MAKGGQFENEVCKDLSLWWSKNRRDDVFCRSRASGAWFTARKKSGKKTFNQGADIMANSKKGRPLTKKFSFECKTGYGRKRKSGMKRWDVLDFLDSAQEQPILIKMWRQACNDASETGRIPVLIFRRNARQKCIALSRTFFQILKKHFSILKAQYLELNAKHCHLAILPLQDFFKMINTKKKRNQLLTLAH